MRRRSLTVVLVSLMILSALMAGCRRSSAAPPLEEQTTEEEAAAAMQEAQANSEEVQQAEEEVVPTATEESTETPAETEAEAPEPTEETAATPEPTATTAPVEQATEEPEPEPITPVATDATTHVVQPGENLFRISLQYGITVQAISQANNITNPALIYVGQTLQIPAGSGTTAPPAMPGQTCDTVYVVQPGDNLFRIALSYDYSQYYLAQYNGIANPSLVYVGQQICIP
jgi:LysM repeat protein